MKKSLLILPVVLLAAGIVIYVNSNKKDDDEQAKVVTQDKPTTPSPKKKEDSFEGYSEWKSWSNPKFLKVVTERARLKDLPKEDREFFREQIENKDIPEVIRNNMANGLVYGKNQDPELYKVFLKMYEDETQSPKWRDYSLQFLAESLDFSNAKEEVVKKLKDVAEKSKNNDAATALIVLDVKQSEKIIAENQDDYQKMTDKLNDPATFHTTKVAIIGIIRRKNDTSKVPLLLECVKKSENNSVIRTGLAAIGVLGDESQRPFILKYKNSESKSIRLAANYALKQLDQKKSKTVKVSKKNKGDSPA